MRACLLTVELEQSIGDDLSRSVQGAQDTRGATLRRLASDEADVADTLTGKVSLPSNGLFFSKGFGSNLA